MKRSYWVKSRNKPLIRNFNSKKQELRNFLFGMDTTFQIYEDNIGQFLLWAPTFLVEELLRIKIFTEKLLFYLKKLIPCAINFFRRVTFWKKLIFQKSSIAHCLLFLESYFFRVATFAKDVTFHIAPIVSEELFFTTYFFRRDGIWQLRFLSTATVPINELVIRWARYQLRTVRVLSCVFIIAQSRIIDKVYLISWLHRVLWNYFFWVSYVSTSKSPTFSKQL